jgi:hypothetical protein
LKHSKPRTHLVAGLFASAQLCRIENACHVFDKRSAVFSNGTLELPFMHKKPKLTPEEARKDHNQMLRFLLVNCVFGIVIGLVLTAALLYFDVGGFWTKVRHASTPVIAVLLVAAPLSMLLGGASMSTAIMLMPYDKKYDD